MVLNSSRMLLSTPLPAQAQEHSAQLPLSARPHSAHAAAAMRRASAMSPGAAAPLQSQPVSAALARAASSACAPDWQAPARLLHAEQHGASPAGRRGEWGHVPPLWSASQQTPHAPRGRPVWCAASASGTAEPSHAERQSGSGAVLASEGAANSGRSGFVPMPSELHATPRLTSALRALPHTAAGELHTGPAGDLSLYEFESPYIAENAQLRQHLAYLIEELDRQNSASSTGEALAASAWALQSDGTATGDAALASAGATAPPQTAPHAATNGPSRHGMASLDFAPAMPAAKAAAATAYQRSSSDAVHAALPSAWHASDVVATHSSGWHRSNGAAPPPPVTEASPQQRISPLPPLWSAPNHTPAPPRDTAHTPCDAHPSAAEGARGDAHATGAGSTADALLERTEARLAAAQRRLQAKEAARAQAHRALARFRALGQQLEAQLQAVTEVRRTCRWQRLQSRLMHSCASTGLFCASASVGGCRTSVARLQACVYTRRCLALPLMPAMFVAWHFDEIDDQRLGHTG